MGNSCKKVEKQLIVVDTYVYDTYCNICETTVQLDHCSICRYSMCNECINKWHSKQLEYFYYYKNMTCPQCRRSKTFKIDLLKV